MREPRAKSIRRSPLKVLTVLLFVVAMVAAACSSSNNNGTSTAANESTTAQGGGAGKTIKIGWIPWDEDVAVTHLWKKVLEDKGYKVELTQLDVGPVYSGMAKGDPDLFLDGWLPTTHADYWKKYKANLQDVGVWYTKGTLNLAVPSYVDVSSIDELKGKASEFNGQIIGIEPGAGLMRITRTKAIPEYGLDNYTLVEGSTPAMLAELKRALDRKQPIVVTLWHPHWAYAAYDIKDLKDPKGAMGGAEKLHAIGKKGFSNDFPQVATWLGNFKMSDDALASLENLVINKYGEGKEAQAVEEWLKDPANQKLVDSWTT